MSMEKWTTVGKNEDFCAQKFYNSIKMFSILLEPIAIKNLNLEGTYKGQQLYDT